MAIFNLSFLAPGGAKKGKSTYGLLSDQLSMLENQLEVDGKLSPGDYDLLVTTASKLRNSPGLTPDNRSAFDVKISSYQKNKSVNIIKDYTDITRINNELKNDDRKTNMMISNDPQKFLAAKAMQLQSKLYILKQSIDQMESSGADASVHNNEYASTLSEYQDILQAQSDSESYQGGSKPTSNFAAFITTNGKGEITNVEIGRAENRTGYSETNGVYGGLQIYGKARKDITTGEKVFQIGNEKFSAPDIMMPDPNNPMSMRGQILQSSDTKTPAGGIETGKPGVYKDLDFSQIKIQSTVPNGGWAQGEKGNFYQKLDDGSGYRKFINTKREDLVGVGDFDILPVPKEFESIINGGVTETVDRASNTIPFNHSTTTPVTEEMKKGPSVPTPGVPQKTLQDIKAPTVFKPLNPTYRAPQSALGIGGKTQGEAKGFFSKLFGQ